MANKQLTATVRLNTTRVEQQLQNLAKSLDALNHAAGKNTNAYVNVNNALRESVEKTNKAKKATDQWSQATHSVKKGLSESNNTLGKIGNKIKSIAAAYLGIQGTKAVLNTSDTITSAENRINALNGGDVKLTQETLDKMYASAQKVRMGYADMVSNASKSMTLAGDAFQGNMDNAIRFQEIMSEAYTLGGASAAEQSTSMYQMIQALGAGTLAGDELRSVREGAPLAYQAIEKFAQGIYNTKESLKDLASQGKITSDMVVAAIMDSGKKMDEEFGKTKITFAQSWEMIKNTATKAFEPVLQKLAEVLQKIANSGALTAIANILLAVADAVSWAFNIIGKFFSWCSDNWYWLQYIVIGVLTAIIAYHIYLTAVAIAQAAVRIAMWIAEHTTMLGILGLIGLLVAGIVWLSNTTVSGCEFMVYALLMVAAAMLIIGIVTGNIFLLVTAIILALAALFIAFAQEIIGGIYWVGAVFANIGLWCANVFVALINAICAIWNNVCAFFVNLWEGVTNWLSALWNNCVAGIVNVAMALWNSIKAIGQNIGIAFENAWIGAQNCFWGFIAAVLKGIKWLEPAINAVAKVFGAEGFTLSGLIEDVENKQQSFKSFVSVGDAWSSGMNTRSYQDLGDAWSSGWNTRSYTSVGDAWSNGGYWLDGMNTNGYLNLNDAYNNGAQVGAGIQDWVGGIGDSVKGSMSGLTLDNLGKTLMTDTGRLPTAATAGGAYNQPTPEELLSGVDSIDKNTGDINDKLDDDDLEYLRKLAEMEVINKFTTAEIKVDMTNNNNINSERDWDDLLMYFSDRVSEEARMMADGLHY